MSNELKAGRLVELPFEKGQDCVAAKCRLPVEATAFYLEGLTCWSGQSELDPVGWRRVEDVPWGRKKRAGYDARHWNPAKNGLSYNQLRIRDTSGQEHVVYVLSQGGKEIHFEVGSGFVELSFIDDDCLKPLTSAMIYLGSGYEADSDIANLLVDLQEKQGVRAVTGKVMGFSWAPWGRDRNLRGRVLRDLDVACELGFDIYTLDDGYAINGDYKDAHWVNEFVIECRLRGIDPGIWYAPYIVSPESRICKDHSDWLLRDSKGGVVDLGSLSPYPMLALDASLLEVQQNAFDLMVHFAEMGVIAHKIDFMPAPFIGKPRNTEFSTHQNVRMPVERFHRWCGENNFPLVSQICGLLEPDYTHLYRYGMDSLMPPNGAVLAKLKNLTHYVGSEEIVTWLERIQKIPGSEVLVKYLTREFTITDVIQAIAMTGEVRDLYDGIYRLSMNTLLYRFHHRGTVHEPNVFPVDGVSKNVIDEGLLWILEMVALGRLGNICIGDRLARLSPRQLRRVHSFISDYRDIVSGLQ